MKTILRILRILALVLFLVIAAYGYIYFERTLVAWWIPVGVSLSAALLTSPFYRHWSWLTVTGNRTVNLLCHAACTAICAWTFFLWGNYYWADPASTEEMEVQVLEKQMEKHQKRRKVGKRTYVNDGFRYEYYLTVAFNNGNTERLHVSPTTYKRARKGKPWKLVLRQGRFGLPVITEGM